MIQLRDLDAVIRRSGKVAIDPSTYVTDRRCLGQTSES